MTPEDAEAMILDAPQDVVRHWQEFWLNTEVFDADRADFKWRYKWAICPRCEGDGHHGPGWTWTASEFDEQFGPDGDEFMEDMRRGAYDVPCERGCENGKVKVLELNEDQVASLSEWLESHYETEAMYRMERMMGA